MANCQLADLYRTEAISTGFQNTVPLLRPAKNSAPAAMSEERSEALTMSGGCSRKAKVFAEKFTSELRSGLSLAQILEEFIMKLGEKRLLYERT